MEKSANKNTVTKREPTPYNKYMRVEIVRVKEENPDLNHKECFKIAAGNWRYADENPSKKTKP